MAAVKNPWEAAPAKVDAPAAPVETAAAASETAPATPEASAPIPSPTPEATAPETAIQKLEEEVKTVEGELVDMVIVTVPKDFKLALDHANVKEFKAGVQRVEKYIAEHWFAKANGVKIFEDGE